MTMGERITALRKGRGMTQEQLAERLSVTRQSVSKWELDQATPEVGFAVALCELFEVSLDYLIRGKETEPPAVAVPLTASVEEVPSAAKTPPVPRPMTARGYVRLLTAIILLTAELCLHLSLLLEWLLGNGAGMTAIPLSFIYMLPLPALYLATRRWVYPDQRTAMRRLWQITGISAVVGNLLYVGCHMVCIRYIYPDGDTWFWFTAWEAVFYNFLLFSLLSAAVLIPIAVCCRNRPRLCWSAYGLWVLIFPLVGFLIEQLWDILPIHDRFFPALAILLLALIALSQYVVYRRLLPASVGDAAVDTVPRWRTAGMLALLTVSIFSMGEGLYISLAYVFGRLPMVLLTMLWLPLPALCMLLLRGRTYATTRAALLDTGKLTGVFLPMMLLCHAAAYGIAFWLTSAGGPIPSVAWGSLLMWSLLFALVGAALTVPAMVAVRKRPWACGMVYGVVVLVACAAMLQF